MSKADQVALHDALIDVYALNKDVVTIEPGFLADCAWEVLKFPKEMHAVGYWAAHQHACQMAREILRQKADPVERAKYITDDQLSMFDHELQDRYPRRPIEGQQPGYTLRRHLSELDRWHNIDRMAKSAKALTKHVEAFKAETMALFGPRKIELPYEAAS